VPTGASTLIASTEAIFLTLFFADSALSAFTKAYSAIALEASAEDEKRAHKAPQRIKLVFFIYK
jgi:hypothetical protein